MMCAQWAEEMHVEIEETNYEAAITKATLKVLDFLEPDQQVLRHVPRELESPTWCLVRAEGTISTGGAGLLVRCIFEYVYPEDLVS